MECIPGSSSLLRRSILHPPVKSYFAILPSSPSFVAGDASRASKPAPNLAIRRSPAISFYSRKNGGRRLTPYAQKIPDPGREGSDAFQEGSEKRINILRVLKSANSFIPHIVLGSTVLALVYPPSFTWFTTRYYAPALGFLMFAVGVNSSPKDFLEAIGKPGAILTGYIGQFLVKPLLGYLFGTLSVTLLKLPTPIGAGIMLVSCVSGAQLSNYATFLTDPFMAPLSIVMTSLSTATAVFVTPALSLLLIGKKLPVDVRGMMFSITQIVVIPIAAGLLLNKLAPLFPHLFREFFIR